MQWPKNEMNIFVIEQMEESEEWRDRVGIVNAASIQTSLGL